MEFLSGETLQIVLGLVIVILGYLIVSTAWRIEPVLVKLRDGLDLYRQFKSAQSEEGTDLSDKEKDRLLEAMGNIFMEAISMINVVSIWKRIKDKFSSNA